MENPVLKINTKSMHKVQYYDLEEFINKVYQVKDYSLVADEEGNNDTSMTYNVAKEEIDAYDMKKLNDFKEGRYVMYVTRTILIDLCNRDLIPEGEYVINISW